MVFSPFDEGVLTNSDRFTSSEVLTDRTVTPSSGAKEELSWRMDNNTAAKRAIIAGMEVRTKGKSDN